MSAHDRLNGNDITHFTLPDQVIFDYTALMDALKMYSRPRDKVSHREIRAGLLRDTVLDGRGWQAIPAAEARAIFTSNDRASLQELTTAEPDELIRSYRGRFVAELEPQEPAESASSIQIPYLSSLTTPPALHRSVKPDQIVWARSEDACASSDGNVATSTSADGFWWWLDRYAAVHTAGRRAGVQCGDRP